MKAAVDPISNSFWRIKVNLKFVADPELVMDVEFVSF